jgi:pimeloyl-ACP methyl ester carboxylesterase
VKRSLMVVLMLAACVAAAAAEPQKPADQWLAKPVDEKTFKSYLDFFAYERQAPFATRITKTEDDQGLRRQWLSFESTRGQRVTATLTEQAGGPAGKKPAIILLHGGVAKGKEGPTRFVDLFARAGWSVLAIDMPHFGERATGLLTTFSEQEKHEKLYNEPSTYLSWITQVTKDVRRSYDLLVNERGADPKRIALIGISRGAIVASIAGAVEKRLAGVALVYGGHFDALETGHLPAACPANYIGRIAPRPLFMINGTQDSDMIRDRSVEPLFKVAKKPKQIIWTDGGHMFMTEEHRAEMIQWLRQTTR